MKLHYTNEFIKHQIENEPDDMECEVGMIRTVTQDEVTEMRNWIRDCRDKLLYPLSQENNPLAEVAESLGQASAKFQLDEES